MIGERLRWLREQAGYSQKEVAKALCVSHCTYAYYELGKLIPSIFELGKLSKVFKVSMDELVKGGLPS